MNELRFYKSDPLASLFIDKWRLSPVKLAIYWTLVIVIVGALASLASGTSISRGGQTGLLQDTTWLVWSFLFTPVIVGYYLWVSNSFAELTIGINNSGVTKIDEGEIWEIEAIFNQKWRVFLASNIALVVGVIYFASRPIFASYAAVPPLPRWGTTFSYTLLAYVAVMLITTLILNVWALRHTLKNKVLNINPLHPDRCGGLRVLSAYSIKVVYLIAMFGFIVGVEEFRFIIFGIAQKNWEVNLIVPLYLALAALAFFAPLSTAHIGMKQAKEKLLNRIANQFWDEYLDAHRSLSKEPDKLEEELKNIQQLQSLHQLTEKFPVWPFDTGTLRRFFATITTPLIPPIIGIILELLQSQLFQ